MIPETSPPPVEDLLRPPRPERGPESEDLREGHLREGLRPVRFLHDAQGNRVVPPFPVLEVERPQRPESMREVPRAAPRSLWLWLLAALLAPLLVLLGALALPVSDTISGAVLVGGWILLGVAARWLEKRRRRHRR